MFFSDSCSHELSHVYYSKTILDSKIYLATQCSNSIISYIEEALLSSIFSYPESCKDEKRAYMGNEITENAKGDFHLVIKTVSYKPSDIGS